MDKAREIPCWCESEVFSPLDDMVASLRSQLGNAALVELTVVIAFANFTTRPHVALGIESAGFAAACGLKPLASATASRS